MIDVRNIDPNLMTDEIKDIIAASMNFITFSNYFRNYFFNYVILISINL